MVLEELAEEPDGMFLGLPLQEKDIAMGYFDCDLPDDLAHLDPGGAEEPLPLDVVCSVIEADLGAAPARCCRHDGLDADRRRSAGAGASLDAPRLGSAVAIEVRRSDVADRLARGLDALPEPVADCVRQECDYALAAQRQERFWWLYAGHAGVVVPALKRAYSGARVLTTERMQGVSLDKFVASGPSQENRDRAGAALFDYYVGTLFEQGDYDCDPDPGKQLFLPDGRVAFVESTLHPGARAHVRRRAGRVEPRAVVGRPRAGGARRDGARHHHGRRGRTVAVAGRVWSDVCATRLRPSSRRLPRC